jgi:hypothetical protein
VQANCILLSKGQKEECASGVEDFVQGAGDSMFHSYVINMVPITENDINKEH